MKANTADCGWNEAEDLLIYDLEFKEVLQSVLKTLPKRSREVGIRRSEGESLKSIGEHFSLSRERIRQIEASAMRKLHHPARSVLATLAECVRKVERGYPIVLTRHGKDVAVLVPCEELQLLERLRAAGPGAGLASLAGGWEGSEELVRLLEQSERRGHREDPSQS